MLMMTTYLKLLQDLLASINLLDDTYIGDGHYLLKEVHDMPKIKVISDELKGVASRIGRNSEVITNSQVMMMSLIKDMGPGFSGTYPSVMLQYLLGMKKKIDEMTNKINEYREFIGNAADSYEWKDHQIANWYNAGLMIPGYDPNTGTYTERSYDSSEYQRYSDYRTNCFAFINAILKVEGREDLDDKWAGKYAYWKNKETIEGGQFIKGITSNNSPTVEDIKNIFSNAQVGDVVQMKWNSWSNPKEHEASQHTAIISKIDEKGVEFLQSNTQGGTINNKYYTWNKLADYFTEAGDGGGASIYRMDYK